LHYERMKWWLNRHLSITRALQGGLLAIGAPLGWLLILALDGQPPETAIRATPGLFAYMLFGTMSVFAGFGWIMGGHEQAERDRGLHDGLTGLYNAEFFHIALGNVVSAMRRHEQPVALVIFDLDHFKRINDSFGHAAGDEVLRHVGHAVADAARGDEIVVRIGGEEFALLMPGSTLQAAETAAERLRQIMAQSAYCVVDGERHSVTASFGCAARQQWAEAVGESLFNAADQAMYAAKQAGRNRVLTEDNAALS